MSYYELGAGVTLALFLIGWVASIEIRLKSTQGKLLVMKEGILDNAIVAKTHALDDATVNKLLKEYVSGDPTKPS